MAIISYILLAILGIAFTIVGLYFLILITRNVKQGLVVRHLLAKRVESLRMTKMLRGLGLDFNQYLHTVPLSKVSESMGKCESCPTTEICDDKLKQGSLEIQDIDFCPNQECLGKFSTQKEQEDQQQ
ncbi:MAG: hypothetical protein GY744_16385 [Gammaproteobacteria bacterium]|nr:hypothetical protein [Gammaproteobacteria bacterium]